MRPRKSEEAYRAKAKIASVISAVSYGKQQQHQQQLCSGGGLHRKITLFHISLSFFLNVHWIEKKISAATLLFVPRGRKRDLLLLPWAGSLFGFFFFEFQIRLALTRQEFPLAMKLFSLDALDHVLNRCIFLVFKTLVVMLLGDSIPAGRPSNWEDTRKPSFSGEFSFGFSACCFF